MLSLNPTVRVGGRTSFHFFEGFAFGLLDNEECIEYKCKVEYSKHQKRPPAQIIDCVGSDLGHGEVPEPLGGGSNSDATLANTRGKDFTHVELQVS